MQFCSIKSEDNMKNLNEILFLAFMAVIMWFWLLAAYAGGAQ